MDVFNKLGEEDSVPILCKSSAAIASRKYWEVNFNQWLQTVNNTKTAKKLASVMEEEDIL